MDEKKTNAERLDALLAVYAPKALAYHRTYKMWPRPGDESEMSPADAIQAHSDRLVANDKMNAAEAQKQAESSFSSKATAPYVVKTIKDGLRVLITKDDGTVIAGSGATMDEALTKLEAER